MRRGIASETTRGQRTQLVLGALRAHKESTVAELSRKTSMSRPTVTNIIADLERLGLVAQSSLTSGTGRPAALYSFAPRHGFVVAADLRRDDMVVIAASISGVVLHTSTASIQRGGREERLEEVVTRISDLVASLRDAHGDVVCGVVAATGIIDGQGVILRSYLVPQWHDLPLAEELTSRLGFPVHVDNDINLSAYGEYATRVSAGTLGSDETLLLIRLFAGLRTGLVLAGEVHQGSRWHAGEINDSLDMHLRARHNKEDDGATWAARAGNTVAAAAAVVDPTIIVLSIDGDHAGQQTAALTQHLESMRLPTAPAIRVESAALDGAGASVGAVSMAVREAERRLLDAHTNLPMTPDGVEAIVQACTALDREGAEASRRAVVVSEPLRVGVVGLGMRSQIAAHCERNGAVVVGAADPDPTAAQRLSHLLGKDPADFALVRSVRELVEFGIGAAIVTSPDDTHSDVCAELLEAGIPVYLEKPIATTMGDATRILTKAYETRTRLYVGHNMRHMSVVRQLRQLILDDAIGEVRTIWCRHFVGNGGDYYFKDWHADRTRSNSLLLQKAAHDIDVMHWLAGSEALDVVGMGDLMVYGDIAARAPARTNTILMPSWFSLDNWPPESQTGLNPVVDVEDVSMLMMRMTSGVLAAYQQCHFSPDYWRNYTVIGTRGRIENFGDGEGGTIRLWNRRSFYNADGDEQFPILGDKDGHGDADALTVAEFLRFVRTGAPTDTSPLGAWQAVATGIQATESLRDGSTPRQVPSLPPEVVEYFRHNQQVQSA